MNWIKATHKLLREQKGVFWYKVANSTDSAYIGRIAYSDPTALTYEWAQSLVETRSGCHLPGYRTHHFSEITAFCPIPSPSEEGATSNEEAATSEVEITITSSVEIDKRVPPGTIEFRHPKTGELLLTVYNIKEGDPVPRTLLTPLPEEENEECQQ